MESRSSERLVQKRKREDELEASEVANTLVSLKGAEDQSKSFSFKKESIDPLDSLTSLLVSIYGEDAVKQWKESGKPIRNIWELSPPEIQCKRTIGQPSLCWLCGGNFDLSKEGLTPQCEHVLPIAQSVFFLSLYSSKKAKDYDPGDETLFKLEYDWAHSICNNLKSALLFITPVKKASGTVSGMRVDSKMVNIFLTRLSKLNSSKDGMDYIKSRLATPQQIDIQTIAVSKRLQKIVDFINEPISRGEGNLQLLAQSSSYVNPTTVHPVFRDLMGGRKTFRRKNNGKSVRRSTAKGNVSNSRPHRKGT